MKIKNGKWNDNNKQNNNINYIREMKKKKLYRFPLITRMGKFDTKINWRLNNNFTKYLFDFFICKDIQKIGNVNIFFRNFSINHSFKWIQYLKNVIKTEYNIELPENQIDNNFKEANQMKRKYKIKNYDGLYLLIENNRLNIMKLAQYSNWV